MIKIIKNKKAFSEELIKILVIIIAFAIIGAAVIYILTKYGVI